MNSRERVTKTLRHEEVDRIPRHLWILPSITAFRKEEYNALIGKYCMDIESPGEVYGKGRRCAGVPCVIGSYTDAWGAVWHVNEDGVVGEVKEFPLSDWNALDSYELPWELLDEADFSRANVACAKSDKFMLAETETRPFERMQFLRGTENLYMDLAYGEKQVYELRDRLHEYFVKEMHLWAQTDVDGVQFMDDWGTQNSLLISPQLWRSFFKPLYKEYCDILHAKGKYVFFHSDGFIEPIFGDLVEIGVDAINSQLFCMDIEKLSELYASKVAIWGEIDRQFILPFGTVADVRKAVRRVADAFIRDKRTGVIAQCSWGTTDPYENIDAVYNEWDKI